MEQVSLVTRRLAAIAFADVVGWSSHIERNDLETLNPSIANTVVACSTPPATASW
jgi:hypothetical protein